MAGKRKSAVEVQKELVLDLMLRQVHVFLTRDGKDVLFGTKMQEVPVVGGGVKLIYGAKQA